MCGAVATPRAWRCGECRARLGPPVSPLKAAVVVALVLLGVAVLAIPALWRAVENQQEFGAVQTLRAIRQAQVEYQTRNGRYASLEELDAANMLDPPLSRGALHGYRYACRPSASHPERWMAIARPTRDASRGGSRYYLLNQSGEVYSRTSDATLQDDCAIPPGSTPVETQ